MRAQLTVLRAFTLIEVMVATTIVVILAGILISATDLTARSFQRTSAKIEQFAEARRGFEVMTRRLAEATLNTYWDYYDRNGNERPTFPEGTTSDATRGVAFVPYRYGRKSDLRFCSGPMATIDPSASGWDRPTHGVFFQAPIGEVEDRDEYGALDQTLNSWGYFLEVDTDKEFLPSVLKPLVDAKQLKERRRSRLMEFREPTEKNTIYFPDDPAASLLTMPVSKRNFWFINNIDDKAKRDVRVVAENVVALIVLPRLSRSDEVARKATIRVSADSDALALSPAYLYDSTQKSNHTPDLNDPEVNPRNQLPPVVQVVMVALDETSADRLDKLTKDKPGFDLKTEEIFKRSVRLEDDPSTPEPSDGELAEFEKKLIELKLTYRVFNTNVIIRGAKWSRTQKL